MIQAFQITVLTENAVRVRGLRAEHGLSIHLKADGRSLLFDTGQSGLLLDNARHLGMDLAGLDAVVLSHGHYDHTGGLEAVLGLAPQAGLFLHPAALLPKFARNADGSSRAVGVTPSSLAAVGARKERVVETTSVTEVFKGVFVTGEIPRLTSFEDAGGPFFLDGACRQPDVVRDDQALFFDTAKGVVVVLGCAHAGVVNTLHHIQRLTQYRPFHAVVGGMHLLEAGQERCAHTLQAIRILNPSVLIPLHCTGARAVAEMWTRLPDSCADGATGTVVR